MEKSPRNKMIGAADETTKSDAPVVRDEAAESSGKRRFYFSQLGFSIEADTQEEAKAKAQEIINSREK